MTDQPQEESTVSLGSVLDDILMTPSQIHRLLSHWAAGVRGDTGADASTPLTEHATSLVTPQEETEQPVSEPETLNVEESAQASTPNVTSTPGVEPSTSDVAANPPASSPPTPADAQPAADANA